MIQTLPLSLCFLTLLSRGNGATLSPRPTATPTVNERAGQQLKAITPTTKGQIGINPVESYLGDASTYWGSIDSTDTRYITTDETRTKWIGVNTEYLSMDGTSTVQVVFATATAVANGHNIGDVSIILPEGLSNALRKSMQTAIETCEAAATKFRREMESRENLRRQTIDILECAFRYAKIDTEEGGTFDAYITAKKWLDAGLSLAEDAAPVVVKYVSSLLTKEEIAKTIVWLAFFDVGYEVYTFAKLNGGDPSLKVVAKVVIPAAGFGSKPKDKDPETICDGSESLKEDSPLCSHINCLGQLLGRCVVPPLTFCPCVQTIESSDGQPWDLSWTLFQQQWLSDVFNQQSGGSDGGQQLALASYTNPLGDPDAWDRMISYDSNKLSILVANVLNGPDYVINDRWNSVIKRAKSSGKTIIGYVRTGYLGLAHDFKTRLGSADLAAWASQIEQDVDKWYELYNDIGEIFFDKG